MTDYVDPRRSPTTTGDPGTLEGAHDEDEREEHGADNLTETDTHTAALQGIAAGGAMGGRAGYLGGLETGSDAGIGMATIDRDEDEQERREDAHQREQAARILDHQDA